MTQSFSELWELRLEFDAVNFDASEVRDILDGKRMKGKNSTAESEYQSKCLRVPQINYNSLCI